MLLLYLLFYKTSSSVSTSYQLLVTVSLVQWGALLWQVWFWVQDYVGIPGCRYTKYRVPIGSSTYTGTGGERFFHDNIGSREAEWCRLSEAP